MGQTTEEAGVVLAQLDDACPFTFVRYGEPQVLTEQCHSFLDRRVRKELPRCKIVFDVPEDLRICDSTATDHNGIAPGRLEHHLRLLRSGNISVHDNRNRHRFLDARDP